MSHLGNHTGLDELRKFLKEQAEVNRGFSQTNENLAKMVNKLYGTFDTVKGRLDHMQSELNRNNRAQSRPAEPSNPPPNYGAYAPPPPNYGGYQQEPPPPYYQQPPNYGYDQNYGRGVRGEHGSMPHAGAYIPHQPPSYGCGPEVHHHHHSDRLNRLTGIKKMVVRLIFILSLFALVALCLLLLMFAAPAAFLIPPIILPPMLMAMAPPILVLMYLRLNKQFKRDVAMPHYR
jgi:hypothetical protein